MKKYMALELAEVALSDFNIRVNNPNKDPRCIVAYLEIDDVTVAILRSVQKMKVRDPAFVKISREKPKLSPV